MMNIMPTYIALLRGINVGGHAKVAMADLRALLQDLGHDEVRTYLQSGNAVFDTGRKTPSRLASDIESAISAQLGLDIRVLVRTRDEFARVIDENPFPAATATPTQLHVMFLASALPAKVAASLDATPYEPDEFRSGKSALYLLFPNGMGRSKLPTYLCERRLGVSATMRNWNTVTRLLTLADG